MSAKNMTEEQRAFLHERGPVSQLQLVEWELEELTASERMSIQRRVNFLRAFALRGIVLDGCTAAGVSRTAVNTWRETSEWFETLYCIAQDEAADRIEAEAFRRGVEGYDEPVIFQGLPSIVKDKETGEERILTVRKYSDTLMQMMLRGAKPDKYRENHRHEVEGGAGGVLIVPAAIDPDAWAKAARDQQAKYAGNEGTDGKKGGA